MAALATPADIEARLGRTLTDEETARVDALLSDISAYARGYTGQDFALQTTTVILPITDGDIFLPQRPVVAVSSVKTLDEDGLPGPSTPWEFDGVGTLCVGTSSWVINGPAWWADQQCFTTAEVTYQHGYAETPDDVLAAVCGAVIRNITSPNPMVSGINRETIGEYSYGLAAGTVSGPSVYLSDRDKRILDRYRLNKSGSVKLRM